MCALEGSDSEKINSIVQKIKHFLITNVGKTSDQASMEEFYFAFISSLREEIMINWTASRQTWDEKQARMLYYLSMEYLPGRYLGNNISNVGVTDLIKQVIKNCDRNFQDLIYCESDPGLGNGGLGRLAACFLDSLSTLHYPYYAYGLRYQYGIFEQEIWNGVQVEKPDCWLLNQNPWEFRKDAEAIYVHMAGRAVEAKNSLGEDAYLLEEYEEVRSLPYDTPIIGFSHEGSFSVGTLRLWSTKESPRNFELQKYNAGFIDQAAENTTLTDVLYPNDHHETGKRIRLKQEFLLVSSSIQDIISRHVRNYGDLTLFKEKVRIQINDTHPALVVVELMRRLLKYFDFSWNDAWETTQMVCSYTNHTVLKEALEEWNEYRIEELLPRQYRLIQEINRKFLDTIDDPKKKESLSIIQDGQIKMAYLSILGSHKVNGVAKLHSEILKESVFKDFYELFPDKFTNVTNGVTQRRWLCYCNPKLSNLISECIGDSWKTHFSEIKKFAEFASKKEIQDKFLDIKKENKKHLFDFLIKINPIRDPKGRVLAHSKTLEDDNILVDLQIKRIHEYKRPLLNILRTIILYFDLKENKDATSIKRMSIIGGKAAPGYAMAKKIIRLIFCVSRKIEQEKNVSDKLSLTFIENYNVSKAEILIPAADLSEQISTAGMEASGTGNMKFAMNGALTIGTDDGANIEMRQAVTDQWWPFLFGSSSEEISKLKQNSSYNPKKIYEENPRIKQALDSLKDGYFAETDEEKEDFLEIYNRLIEDHPHNKADPFFVLLDLEDYLKTQEKAEELFSDPYKWAEYAINNIAGMGNFSTDYSIDCYAKNIWGLEPCPPDKAILQKVRDEYSEHDRCRIV